MRFFKRLLLYVFFGGVLSIPLQGAQAASITVTQTADSFDDGNCSLRDAIESVNTGGDFGGCDFDETQPFGTQDTINLVAGTYTLSEEGAGEDDNASGDLDISRSVIINGVATETSIVSASGLVQTPDRVFHIVPQPLPPVEVVEIGGAGNGAPIVSFQNLTIRDGDASGEDGGGLLVNYLDAQVTLTNLFFTLNTCSSDGGALANANAMVTVQSSLFTLNEAGSDAGASDTGDEGTTAIFNTTMDDNISDDDGGAIQSYGRLLVVNSTISNNDAINVGGEGGGTEGRGGGIASYGLMAVINSTISGNTAGGEGGGINITSPENSDGGEPQTSFAFLFNVTIADNEVLDPTDGTGGGICFECLNDNTGQGELTNFSIYNTIIADNTATISNDCDGDFVSGGYNLIEDATNCNGFTATGDQTGVDPVLGALADNGGPTFTQALLSGSPAIDRGNDVEGCQGLDTQELLDNENVIFVDLTEDQRGFDRPVAVLDPALPICDIGAFEFQSFDFTVTKSDGLNGQTVTVGENITYTITVNNVGPGDADSVTLTDPLPTGLVFVSANSSQGTCSQAGGTVTCDLGSMAVGATATVTIVATTTTAGTFTNVVTVTSEGAGEVSITKTAQSTSTVVAAVGGNVLLFGGGGLGGCSLTAVGSSPSALLFMAIALSVGWFRLRSRS